MKWSHRKLILHRFNKKVKNILYSGYKDGFGLVIKREHTYQNPGRIILSLNNTYELTLDEWNTLDHSVRNLFKESESE